MITQYSVIENNKVILFTSNADIALDMYLNTKGARLDVKNVSYAEYNHNIYHY